MRLPCPFCGERDLAEFTCRGEVAPPRPDPAAPNAEAGFAAWLYPRINPAGRSREHWRHAAGCRRWLVVERDTRTHEVFAVSLAQGPDA
ncbi:sarcosine oxidase subunit delta [Phenylobacterium sp.]|jgi:sarcosine oxidase subunit delta|uniref:sarcosine oxidase subunit delta n=1 Tax=Phenylobacterium sp. TaxID=1871053 RepID=UPI002F3F1953